MKNQLLRLILLLIVPFVIISCNGDDDEAAPATIIGTWETVSTDVDFSVSMNGIPLPQELIQVFLEASGEDLSILDEEDNSTIQFKNDGTYVVTDDDGTDTGTYTISDDKKKITIDNELEFNVVSLTATNLQIEALIEDSFEEEGDLFEFVMDLEATLRKIN